jgi:multidrug efflux pump subunit AcrA (membrane-fusion protein)
MIEPRSRTRGVGSTELGIARTWVFPILRIVVFAAIAAALVKIAFFPDPPADGAEGGPAIPTAEIVDPQLPVSLGTIRNDVVLDGTVNADAAVAIPATLAGEVRKVSVQQGQWVDAGAEILQIRGMAEDGSPRWSTVKAPAAGVLSSFSMLVGQQVTVGDPVGRIAPPTFNVTASIPPAQQYRLTSQPTQAQVAITGGPAPFTCTGLTITTPLPGQDAGGEGGDPGAPATGGGATVRCAVPADVRVFPGLAAKVTIAGGVAENVLVVPTTAVEGGSGTGVVYVAGPDGATEPRDVTLGLSDGIQVEVTGGLEEGEMILQFVPGAPAGEGGMPGGPIIIEG